MFLSSIKNTYLFLVLVTVSCVGQTKRIQQKAKIVKKKVLKIKTGAAQTDLYLQKLKGKKVAVVANQTSIIFKHNSFNARNKTIKNQKPYTHLVDSLLYTGINVKKVFAPEHGFRGKVDAGEYVKDGIDTKTNLPIISLYGENKKPTQAQLNGIEVVIFDIQDVGVRFYTYISTLHYVMEACAEAQIPVIVLDRPNPNGHYIDGPVLEPEYKSFVGMHKVPVVYGMTIGEYGKMINGEQWLNNGLQCDLTVIPLQGYTHKMAYSLPVKPSPNLPNDESINLYPSLCFFEGTNVSVGRGTNKQFQIYGSPYLKKTTFSFTPQPNEGAKYPKYKNRMCYGENLQATPRLSHLNLSWLLKAYKETSAVKTKFWDIFFTKLAGTKKLQQQIEQGLREKEIKNSWQKDLKKFKKIRQKYLMYN